MSLTFLVGWDNTCFIIYFYFWLHGFIFANPVFLTAGSKEAEGEGQRNMERVREFSSTFSLAPLA